MQAVEFQAIVKNGMIEIPREYRNSLSRRVRVIVLAEENQEQYTNLIDDLLENPLKIQGFQPLTREETHKSEPMC